MAFEIKKYKHPLLGATGEWIKPVGRVSQEKLADVEAVCQRVPPPAQQYELRGRLVPASQIYHCQHWPADAIEALRNNCTLEPLGPDDSADIIRRDQW
jgi:hypothetical protein